MFLNEQKLFELKYQINSAYYDKCLAEIFLLEYRKIEQNLSIFNFIKHFYHKYSHDEMQCSVKFDDNSILLIEKHENQEWSQITIYNPDYLHVYKQFKRMGGSMD